MADDDASDVICYGGTQPGDPHFFFEVSAMRVVWVVGGAKPGDNNFADVVAVDGQIIEWLRRREHS